MESPLLEEGEDEDDVYGVLAVSVMNMLVPRIGRTIAVMITK